MASNCSFPMQRRRGREERLVARPRDQSRGAALLFPPTCGGGLGTTERGDEPLPRPACGGETSEARSESVGVRGRINRLGLAESPPHPALRADLSPQAGRGDERGCSARANADSIFKQPKT